MATIPDYVTVNRASWNNRTEAHLRSDFYDVPGFLRGASSLNAIELELLGNIAGQSLLHLQCHFGQDTISLARMGAQATGVDLSDKAIDAARDLARDAGTDARFICSNVYDLPEQLDEQFDIVFSSYGTIGWLPDIDRWAALIARYLKPGGRFVFAEFHPFVWTFDDDFQKVAYRYFNSGPIVETESGTYADREAPISQQYVCWNHGLAEVIGALVRNGLALEVFNEYDYSPYNCFRHTVEVAPKQFRIEHLGDKIPMVYALVARKG
ncbi:MAG: class I SAM-dependent methyltransferase [Chitinophagaceae bacterium]|nr:MAG: class I SAM-dependent methyltransferase [Chitinophagaceae bacterium]